MRKKMTATEQYSYAPTTIRLLYKAKELLTADVRNYNGIKDLARKAGTNEFTLKKGFRDIFNTSIYKCLLDERMKKAACLLKTTTLREAEIARECGFFSLAGFITTHRKYFGNTPGETRKIALSKKLKHTPSRYSKAS